MAAEISYVAGRLSVDAVDGLRRKIESADGALAEISFAVGESAGRHVLTALATLLGTNPAAAVAELSDWLDDALMATGLFEEFDVSGKVLLVVPYEYRERLSQVIDLPAG